MGKGWHGYGSRADERARLLRARQEFQKQVDEHVASAGAVTARERLASAVAFVREKRGSDYIRNIPYIGKTLAEFDTEANGNG